MTFAQIKIQVEKVLPNSEHVGRMMARAVWLASQRINVHLLGYSKGYSDELRQLARDLCKRCGVDSKWVLDRCTDQKVDDTIVIEDKYNPAMRKQVKASSAPRTN